MSLRVKMSKLDDLLKKYCSNGVNIFPLYQCCNILDNKRKPVSKSSRDKGEYPYYGANGIQDYVSSYIFDGIFILVGEDGSVMVIGFADKDLFKYEKFKDWY